MGTFIGLAIGALLGFSVAKLGAERAIEELKEVIARGEKIRRGREKHEGAEDDGSGEN